MQLFPDNTNVGQAFAILQVSRCARHVQQAEQAIFSQFRKPCDTHSTLGEYQGKILSIFLQPREALCTTLWYGT